MSKKKEAAPKGRPKLAKAESHSTKRNNAFDYDRHIVDRVDESIWSALYAGHFRLATHCLRCGRWLVDGRSKRRHYGAACALKAATEGSAQ